MKHSQLITVLLGGFIAISAQGRVHNYGADLHESNWSNAGSAVYCQLSHQIPNYGEAIFSKSVDEELQFSVVVGRTPSNKDTEATLQSHPPVWKPGAAVRDLGTVDISKSSKPFNIGRNMARRLMLELEEGMFPTLYYSDWADGKDYVNVAISSVNFAKARSSFVQCLGNLLPYGFKDIKHTRLQFPYKKIQLTSQVKRQLNQLARYVTATPDNLTIKIEGHSDSKGLRRINYRVSLKRANAVKAYLLGKGVKASQMEVRGYGERKPITSNRTRKGRAKNRRVEVRLVRK